MRTLTGKSARRQGDLFQVDGGGKQNAPLAQIFDHRGHDDVAAIRSGCLFERDLSNSAPIVTAKGTNAKVALKFAEMRSAGLLSLRVVFERVGVVSQLRRDKGQTSGGGASLTAMARPGNRQKGKMDAKPKPIAGAPTLADQRQVVG